MNEPSIIYGTAWKEEATADLVRAALDAGFRAIDTANQKKHYREDFAGGALAEAFTGGLRREELFLQSKFTYARGQDHRLPYDPTAPYAAQVLASFESTLRNLHTDYLDSFLLHGPLTTGWIDGDRETWTAFEELHTAGRTRRIGVSNVTRAQLVAMASVSRIAPQVVQNRCYAKYGWDRDVREHCAAKGIAYQGFSLLTANPQVVRSPVVGKIAKRLGATAEQVVLRFAQSLGIVVLSGTTNTRHMQDDLRLDAVELSADDRAEIAAITPS